MQLFNPKCKKPHWFVLEGKLMLETAKEKHQDLAKQVITVLEEQIRQKIYDEITAWQPLKNRAQIMKVSGSIDNALLGVQAICADIALGNKNGSN
jgi:hypothetical protein